MRDKKRWLKLLLLLGALFVFYMISRSAPHDQTVHFLLGDAAPRVEEVRVRYGEDKPNEAEEWTREVSFRFPREKAPRIVTHEPRLANGDYVVEIELASHEQRSTRITLRRRVKLEGGATTIDVSKAVPQ